MSWAIEKIRDVCNVVPGFAFKSKDLGDVGVPVIKIGNIRDDRTVEIESAQRLPEDLVMEQHRKFLLEDGDIILAMTGATAGKVGRIRYDGGYCLLNQRVAKFVPKAIDPDFLWLTLSSDRFRTIFYSLAGGAAQPNMSGGQIEEVEIRCPSIDEQERIADILSAYDDLIENNRRRIALLEQAARLLYQEWFVRLRFPGHEHVSITNGVPEGWEKVRVETTVQRVSAGKLFDQKSAFPKGKVPILDQGRGGIIGYHSEEASVEASLDDPVIVFANHTCYQRIIHYPFSTIQNVLPYRPHPDRYRDIYWLHHATDGLVELNAYKGHWPEFMAKDTLFPPQPLCSQFGDFTRHNHRMIHYLERENARLVEARDLLLPRLMNGEIAV
jgi:type I restriction enzyme, S subunit